ncbi:Glyoxylate reductase [Thalictrum thalictroides]|uniref:Glyoxylate reductase n=1 Tax=Thalictrum thalictroides TaxID=46969 RepID=A0A7J6WX11_THATH|nr:Glyoxylate reductase [Thalictrum thalictroides]
MSTNYSGDYNSGDDDYPDYESMSSSTDDTEFLHPYLRKLGRMLWRSGIIKYGYLNHHSNTRSPKPKNLEEIRAIARRARLMSEFTVEEFDRFENANFDTINEPDIIPMVLPFLEGKDLSQNYGEILFTGLKPFEEEFLPALPDRFWGAPCQKLKNIVLRELSDLIEPEPGCKVISPNFFLEMSSPKGCPSVPEDMAIYHGGLGERGQIALRSWRVSNPELDKMAHTFTSTYINGHLTVFSVHAQPPECLSFHRSAGDTEYHLYKINSYSLLGDADQYKVGVTAFRNLRDYAEEIRNKSIEIANRRAEEVTYN